MKLHGESLSTDDPLYVVATNLSVSDKRPQENSKPNSWKHQKDSINYGSHKWASKPNYSCSQNYTSNKFILSTFSKDNVWKQINVININYIHERDVTWIWRRHGLQVWQPALILPKNTTHLGLKSRWVDDIIRHPLIQALKKKTWKQPIFAAQRCSIQQQQCKERSCYGSWLTLLASDFYSQLWFSSGKKCWVSMRVAGDLLISLKPASVRWMNICIYIII